MSDLPDDDAVVDEGPTIEASSELEEALREATEAVEAREAPLAAEAPSPDKLTIELLSNELQDGLEVPVEWRSPDPRRSGYCMH